MDDWDWNMNMNDMGRERSSGTATGRGYELLFCCFMEDRSVIYLFLTVYLSSVLDDLQRERDRQGRLCCITIPVRNLLAGG